jgi:hypothetical protein
MEDDDDRIAEGRGEKQQHQDEAEEISSDIHHTEGSDHIHNTSDEDDEDPQPSKRRKRPSLSDRALAALRDQSPKSRLRRPRSLTPPSATQLEVDDAQFQANHGRPPTPVDDGHYPSPRTSLGPSVSMDPAPFPEYPEWHFHR